MWYRFAAIIGTVFISAKPGAANHGAAIDRPVATQNVSMPQIVSTSPRNTSRGVISKILVET